MLPSTYPRLLVLGSPRGGQLQGPRQPVAYLAFSGEGLPAIVVSIREMWLGASAAGNRRDHIGGASIGDVREPTSTIRNVGRGHQANFVEVKAASQQATKCRNVAENEICGQARSDTRA